MTVIVEHSPCAAYKLLGASHALVCFIFTSPYEVTTIIIPNYQIHKLRLRKAQQLGKGRAKIPAPESALDHHSIPSPRLQTGRR